MGLQDRANGSPLWPWSSTPRPRPRVTLDGYPIGSTEKLRFPDTHRIGDVSNAVFAVCCQSARIEILCDPGRLPISGQARFVMARLELSFLGQIRWPGTAEIGTRVDRVGRSSVSMAQGMFLKEHHVAAGQSTVALIDLTTRRPPCWPPDTARAVLPIAASQSENGAVHALWHRHNGRGA